ncbi:MAG TPA: tetratricopeptide repeat protein, partial [Flavobacteriales bacterium]|nr:tetratricopeptide repeat protein [Flavobacteriales bacterium]
HFDNGFYFDDSHVIVSNGAIRDLGNIAAYFTDATTFSSLPSNCSYRPIVTLMDAIDYRLAGNELNPVYFHAHIFFWYIIQCVLMFFLFRNIILKAVKHKWSDYIALFAVGWYALHAANAETINYISARSDSFSTLCIIATLLLFQEQKTRKYFIYLIPLVLGIYTKQTTVMLYPILCLYVFLFETKAKTLFDGIATTLKQTAPAGIVVIGIFILNQQYLTPESTVSSNTGVDKWEYFSTQWYIITHYLKNFFLPIDLSADPDFVMINGMMSLKKMFGLLIIVIMLSVAYKCYRQKKTRPISFGILWFFIALLPTSSFVPLFQIANDHRTFFPYIGLVLAVSHGIGLILIKQEFKFLKSTLTRISIIGIIFTALAAYGYGTYQRNIIWSSGETLWHDVTVKSPNNARGLMNYGNALMAKGSYEEALSYFQRTLAITPKYSYAHVNMGVLLGAIGKIEDSEAHFKKGILYGPNNPESFYFYGKWLFREKRFLESKKMLEQAIVISPMHTNAKSLLEQVGLLAGQGVKSGLLFALKNLEDNPNYENYLNLSLAYYNDKNWEECINAAQKALELNPDDPSAYNNICTAYIQMGRYEKAIENCNKAIELSPNYQLAKNNLNWALKAKQQK